MNTELFSLEGKTAIVTGGANGIGKGCSIMLSDFGANVVVADLKLEDAKKAAEEIKEKGGKAIAVSCNVTKDEDLTSLVKRTIDEFGGIHILVNNVGGGGAGKESPSDISVDDFAKTFQLNVLALLNSNGKDFIMRG